MTDGDRYRWLVDNYAEVIPDNTRWTSEDGTTFVSNFILQVKGMHISGRETLDELIDLAIESINER